MTEAERLVGILEAARREFGAEGVRRIEAPVRAAAGLEPPAPTGEALRYPEGLFVPGIKSAPWHSRDWMPDVAILEAAAPDLRAELDALLARRDGFQPFDEGEDYGFTPANIVGSWNVY